jgi:alanyl-tRNA synthetase
MKYRRKQFDIGVIYETSISKLKSIETVIKQIIEKQEGVNFEWVRLKDL